MKYLTSGGVLFIIYLFNLLALPRIFFPDVHPVPQWFSVIQIIIAILFVVLGVQTMRLEKKYFAGILFFLLAIIAFITFSLGNFTV